MSPQSEAPVTLADKLRMQRGKQPIRLSQLILIATLILITALISLLSWSSFNTIYPALTAIPIAMAGILAILTKRGPKSHFLIRQDQQGFMSSLNLSDKTAIFDGSNIYHFGLDNGAGRKPLELLIKQLRSDGFRLICFFDANIYFTLLENGEFQQGRNRFSIRILQRVFGLNEMEIYVVPAGLQADLFIVESLSLLPISFAVTNDRYRDYEAYYDFLNQEKHWRKGLQMKQGCLQLYQYDFKSPLQISPAAH